MRLAQAFRAFFRVLSDASFAERVARAASASTPDAAESKAIPAQARAATEPEKPPARPPTPVRATRSDAVTLLAVLQREGRLVDFLQESIEAYPDAQIGAAVRDIHRGCRQALDRIFGLAPAVNKPEGAPHRVEKGYDSGRIRLTGAVTGEPPYSGTLVHPGWEASRCDLPAWTGSEGSARVIAPAEVEVR